MKEIYDISDIFYAPDHVQIDFAKFLTLLSKKKEITFKPTLVIYSNYLNNINAIRQELNLSTLFTGTKALGKKCLIKQMLATIQVSWVHISG